MNICVHVGALCKPTSVHAFWSIVYEQSHQLRLSPQATDGPFFLGEYGESTRVKAMARSLNTPDSGLGPGLYEAAPASFFHHPPQAVIGEQCTSLQYCKRQNYHNLMIKIGRIRSWHASSSMKEKDVHIGWSPGKHVLEVGQLCISSTSAFLLTLLLGGLKVCSISAHRSWHVWSVLALPCADSQVGMHLGRL